MKEEKLFERLDRQNDILQQMLDIMPRRSGRLTGMMETVVLIVGAFGFVGIADTIMKWITGG